MQYLLEATDAACGGSCNSSAAGRGYIAVDTEICEERAVHRLARRNTRAGELEGIRAVETLSEVLCLDVARVHVEVQVGSVASIVAVDVSEERPTRALLVGVGVEHNASMDGVVVPVDAVSVVIDEALAGVKLAASLAIDDENVAAFDGGRGSSSGGDGTEWVLKRKLGARQARNKAKLSNVWLGSSVGSHP